VGSEAEQASRMASNVVPAKFVMPPPHANAFVPARASAEATAEARVAEQNRNTHRKAVNSNVVRTRATQRTANSVKMVRAGFAREAIAPQTLILVVQSARDDDSGIVWNVCVWQITVTGTARNQAEPGIAAKAI